MRATSRMAVPVRNSLRTALLAVLVWQAAAGALAVADRAWSTRGIGLGARFGGGDEPRLQNALGADFALTEALRTEARDGEWALVRVDATALAGVLRGEAYARLTKVRHATFPRPLLMPGGVDPIAAAEAVLPVGRSCLLVALAGDPSPEGRAGWTRLAAGADFAVWRLEKQ